MAKLVYSAITSLDGSVKNEDGRFNWAAPDDEVHAFVNDLARPIGTHRFSPGSPTRDRRAPATPGLGRLPARARDVGR